MRHEWTDQGEKCLGASVSACVWGKSIKGDFCSE